MIASRMQRAFVFEMLVLSGALVSGCGEHAAKQPAQANASALPPDENSYIRSREEGGYPDLSPPITVPAGSRAAEQTAQGAKPAPTVVASFDGLGSGFHGPQGSFFNPSPADNSLAVGPDNIVQSVNVQMAIYTKKGKKFDTTGKVLLGPVDNNTVFHGFGGECEAHNGGDVVVRYDQLANRWLITHGVREKARPDAPKPWEPGAPAALSPPGRSGQPGPAAPMYQPPPAPPPDTTAEPKHYSEPPANTVFGMCYAVSKTSDPLGPWYRYEFLRPFDPDYERPAVWPDGYYNPSSTGDNRISSTIVTQRHACVAERAKMLNGLPATEQCFVVENVNFLNSVDLDGKTLPPAGAPNIIVADGGRQLDSIVVDSVLLTWQFHVDWKNPSKSTLKGPDTIRVAPYHYLCDGQLDNCVPQPNTRRGLDSQGDKLMQRTVYRNVKGHQSIVAVHSVNTSEKGGGVRWYELRVGTDGAVSLYQQGTYAPDSNFRWMPSAAVDKLGNIGIGYSYGGPSVFVGQRFAGRQEGDPLGQLTLREAVLIDGQAAQAATLRWTDYTQTAVDPSDDCTIWYVGNYMHQGARRYTSRIGAFRMPGCG